MSVVVPRDIGADVADVAVYPGVSLIGRVFVMKMYMKFLREKAATSAPSAPVSGGRCRRCHNVIRPMSRLHRRRDIGAYVVRGPMSRGRLTDICPTSAYQYESTLGMSPHSRLVVQDVWGKDDAAAPRLRRKIMP
jgi:hypothetical protein